MLIEAAEAISVFNVTLVLLYKQVWNHVGNFL